MANDLTLPIRRAVLAALKADEPLTELVPATSIYRQSTPSSPPWPFIKLGSPSGIPINASCVDGNECTFAVHGFARPKLNTSGQEVEYAEDRCATIGSFIAAALDRKRLVLDNGQGAKVRWTGSQLLQDGAEADAYHTIQNFRVRVIA